jgi:hypothetical protein
MSDETLEEIILKLGDIIIIYDPLNEILNNNTFFIDYIDKTKIKLINVKTFEKVTLQIDSDGIIEDGNIQQIKIISSNPKKGYARQNGLLPGTWVNIHFKYNDIPIVITGEITNLEEDMIEIRTIDGDVLFINFDYHGIPEDIPIEIIEIREPIKCVEDKDGDRDEHGEKGEDGDAEKGVDKLDDLDLHFEDENEDDVEDSDDKVVKDEIQKKQNTKLLFNINDIEFGDVIKVDEYINIDKDKYRYNLETQTNDLLEEMIANIPAHKRTNAILNNIHTIITRFIQLRAISSTFDVNKNINGIIKITADDRPLVNELLEFKNSLYWILFVSKNIKKIYPEKPEELEITENTNDFELQNFDDHIRQMSDLFKNYKSNKSTEGQNKYIHLYHALNSFMTPFNNIPDEIKQDMYDSANGIIIDGNVNTNINAIVDNLSDMYSTVINNSDMINRKFVMQRYNLGLDRLHCESFKGSKFISQRVKLTNNDKISISSIVTLQEPTVRFSQINLPSSSVLVRSNLNMCFLNYWELLKQHTLPSQVVIDELDAEIEYNDSNFVDDIKQYNLNLTEYKKNAEITNADVYKIFLNTIIPKIKVLFNLVKKYINGRLSFVDVVNYLEPFLIYPSDLTFMQYKEINHFIYTKIREYNTLFVENGKSFSLLKYEKYQKRAFSFYMNPLFSIFEDDVNLNKTIFETYGFLNREMQISGSEFLRKIILADYGNLYNTGVSFLNIQLMFSSNLNNVFETNKDRMAQFLTKDEKSNKCAKYVIAKKYYSIQALEQDNNKQIFYDKEFDKTNYEFLEQHYKTQRDHLLKDELILFLTDDLKKKHKMNEYDAQYMATTLVDQTKTVREGDYALLIITDDQIPEEMQYYKRQNDIWVLVTDIDPTVFIKDDDILCNINYDCIYNTVDKNTCESTEVAKDKIISNALTQIINQFDKNYEISKEQLTEKINTALKYFVKSFDKIQMLHKNDFLKNNDKQYNLGLTLVEKPDKIESPYLSLRYLITSQNDFIKKQNDIIRFANLYCREGDKNIPNVNDEAMEDEWWMYCLKTNTKLLPKFYYILATTFITNNDKYDDVLNELKRAIGKRSDDGDSWVDEHSGEVICLIDADADEALAMNKMIEKDKGFFLSENANTNANTIDSMIVTSEAKIISNVISILSSNMGINMDHTRSNIINVVSELMHDPNVLVSEGEYKKLEDAAAKKNKKIKSYGKLYSSTILYLTLGMYLIAIQTSIPPIKTRKTAPNCVRSFDGFPMFGDESDDAGIKYVACVALKSRDPTTIPWNALEKSQENVVRIIKSFIKTFLLTYDNGNLVKLMKDKQEYLLTNKEHDIPDEHNLDKWTNFLPPLQRFRMVNLQNVSDEFINSLKTDINRSNGAQNEKILVIQSKIIAFSLAIQESIQNLVEKKDLLLRSAGQIFIDNACCNEKNTNITTLQYFNNEDHNIELYNNIVSYLSNVFNYIQNLSQSKTMLSILNTKRVFPEISNEFSEETIYYAFITFCKFQSTIPLNEEFAAICINKPNFLNKMDTIQEKISKLKRDGRNYTKIQFLKLFQLVSRENIIKINIKNNHISCIGKLHHVLKYLNEKDDTKSKDETKSKDDSKSTKLNNKLIENITMMAKEYNTTYTEDTIEMKRFKDFLQDSIDNMQNKMIEFIKKNNSNGITKTVLNKLINFIKELTVWKFDIEKKNEDIKISDDGLYNYTNFLKNFIELLSITFPTMLLNDNEQSIEPPKYWGLSKNHENDVKKMVTDFYQPLNSFYGNVLIKNILNEVVIKSRDIYLLSQTTPTITSIKLKNDIELYNTFDKRTVTLLYEYYMLSVFINYIDLASNPETIKDMLRNPNKSKEETQTTEFFVEEEKKHSPEEQEEEFFKGDMMMLQKQVANLLIAYLNIMMKSKKTLNISYKDIEDKIFKLKEAEKYSFTDKLKDMGDEERAVDTILKHHKLGPLYNLGLSKGIKEYDKDHFEHDKIVANQIMQIENKLKKQGKNVDDIDMDEEIEDLEAEHEIALDNAMLLNTNEDYDDGDPWGDEQNEDQGDYY